MVKVKVCGITSLKDALSAVECGCDALGFVFYKKSPRYISPARARGIIKKLPRSVAKVGVFVNSPKEEIKMTALACGLDMLQLHGDETPGFCKGFKGLRLIRAFRLKGEADIKEVKRYGTFAYLFDTYSGDKFGGTGRSFDRRLLRGLRKIKKPVFLAGGLNADNVASAIKEARPEWVDVSSGVESSPGKKSAAKIRRFVMAAKKN